MRTTPVYHATEPGMAYVWRYKPSRHVLVYFAVTLLTSNEHDICQTRTQGSYPSHNLRKAAVAFTNTKNASTHFALPLPSATFASPWMPEAHPPTARERPSVASVWASEVLSWLSRSLGLEARTVPSSKRGCPPTFALCDPSATARHDQRGVLTSGVESSCNRFAIAIGCWPSST